MSLDELRKQLTEAEKTVFELKSRIKEHERIRQERIDQNNKPIIAAGYEVRTGHETFSTHGDWGDTWKFVIVHKTSPRINRIELNRGEVSCYIGTSPQFVSNDRFILSCGETEQDAWENAIYDWNQIEDKVNGLPLFKN
jgi:hypothetical protein